MTGDNTAQTEWVPQFEGQRPPFEKDNDLAVTHGARSPRKVEAMARRVLNDELLDRYPHLREYPEALTSLARVESVVRLMFADLATGIYDGKGQLKASLIQRFLTAENANAKLRASLGMTPASEAEVARDRAAATATNIDIVSELIKQGRATRAQQGPAAPEPTNLTALATTEAEINSDREDL